MGESAFEIGCRISFGKPERHYVIDSRLGDGWWHSGATPFRDRGSFMRGHVAAPAPKPGQRWENDPCVDVQIVDAGGELVVEPWYNCDVLCRGSVVDVARWLAGRNYRCIIDPCIACVEVENTGGAHGSHSCGRASAEISCESSEEDAAPETVRPSGDAPPAAPSKFAKVPLATSRILVDEAVKTLRGEPFAKAIQATLISLCGDRLEFGPRQVDIQAAIYACQAWEHARGKVAPGKRSLSVAEHRELTETAKIAAWGAGIAMQDASDIGEIVAATYERVRATC